MNLLGAPITDDATDDMLMIDPVPRSSIAGKAARDVQNIDLTFRSWAKFHSSSVASNMVP